MDYGSRSWNPFGVPEKINNRINTVRIMGMRFSVYSGKSGLTSQSGTNLHRRHCYVGESKLMRRDIHCATKVWNRINGMLVTTFRLIPGAPMKLVNLKRTPRRKER